MSADDTLAQIEALIQSQDEFEDRILSTSEFTQAQKDGRLLATRRTTMSQLRALVQMWRESLEPPTPPGPAHDHEWDVPCSINCPWRRALISSVLEQADGPTEENTDGN